MRFFARGSRRAHTPALSETMRVKTGHGKGFRPRQRRRGDALPSGAGRIQAITTVSAAAEETFAEQMRKDAMTLIARETEEARRLIQSGREALHFVELAADTVDQPAGGRSSCWLVSEAADVSRRQRHIKESGGWRAFGCVSGHCITFRTRCAFHLHIRPRQRRINHLSVKRLVVVRVTVT